MAYAQKRGKGAYPWRVFYKKPDGTWTSESGFPLKSVALEHGKAQEMAIKERRWVDPKKSGMLYRDWVPVFMAGQNVDPNTVSQRRGDLEKLLLPGFGHLALHDITLFGAKAWANGVEGYARSRVDKALTLLSMSLSAAVDAGYLIVNPLAGRRRHTGRGRKEVVKAKVYAQPEQIGQIADRIPGPNGLMVLSIPFLACRWGEIAGLHRDNALIRVEDELDGKPWERWVMRIDQEIGTLHEIAVELSEKELAEWDEREWERLRKAGAEGRVVRPRKRPTVTTEQYLGRPKNDTSARTVDLPPFLVGLWREHLESWKHEYMFCGPDGGLHWRGNFGRRHLRPAADGREASPKRRGTPGLAEWAPIVPGYTNRAGRGVGDTWMQEDGVPRSLRYAVMGWATDDIEGVYERITPMMRKRRLDGLEVRGARAVRGTRWDPEK